LCISCPGPCNLWQPILAARFDKQLCHSLNTQSRRPYPSSTFRKQKQSLQASGSATNITQTIRDAHQRKEKKNADSPNTTGLDWERMLFCVLHHPMQWQTTSHQADESLKNKRGKAFQWLGGRGLHTTRSTAQIYLGIVFDASSHLTIFVANLVAYRLDYSMNAVACRPGTPNCGVGSLCGCC